VIGTTAFYVEEHNRVNSRQVDLSQLSIGVAHWSAAAESYSRFTAQSQELAQHAAGVRELVETRYDWENLLSEIAALLPRDAQLSTLSATNPLASTSTGTTVTPTTGTVSGSTALSLTGCATSQYAVANTMVQLQRVTGVTKVLLGTSTRSSTGGETTCTLGVQFDLSLVFASPVNPGATSATSTASPTSTTTATASETEPATS
jgi:Tfp pilus assembly protein PilN